MCIDKTTLEKKMQLEYGFVSMNLRVLEKGPRYYFIKQSEIHDFLFSFFAFTTLVSYAHSLSIYIVYIATIRLLPNETYKIKSINRQTLKKN